jgi:hypothetical protein
MGKQTLFRVLQAMLQLRHRSLKWMQRSKAYAKGAECRSVAGSGICQRVILGGFAETSEGI